MRTAPKKLDTLGLLGRGKSRHRPRNDPSLYGGSYPFFQTGDVTTAELYLHQYSQTYNDKGLAQSKQWPVGTLCITIAANIAETAILKIPGCFPDSIVGFVADPTKSDARFIKYYIDTIKSRMQSASRGTTQDNLSVDKLTTFDFYVPSVTEQSRIASILSAYDDLIENNTRRIAVLEEMARRIYEEWFVHFRFPGHEQVRMVESELGLIPEGWHIGYLYDVVDNVREATRPGDHLASRRYVPIDCIAKRSLVLPEARPIEEAQSSLVLFETGDILFGAMRPYFHKVAIAPCCGVTRTTCFVLRPKAAQFQSFGALVMFSDPVVAYASAHSQGATIPYAVWDGSLAKYPIAIPPNELLQNFEQLVSPILLWLKRAMFRQQNLRTTRDLLLPKLISGELDVSHLPEAEAMAA